LFGSGIPAPRTRGQEVSWNYAVWPANGITVTYAVVCRSAGDFPAHVTSTLELAFDRGSPQQLSFPAPAVHCRVVPTPTPLPTATSAPATPTPAPPPSPLPSATPAPRPIFLPIAVRSHCRLAARRLDAVLVIDTSSSMLERTPNGDVKLELAQNAASQFVDALDLPSDRAAIVAFSGRASTLQPMTGSRAALQLALAGMYSEIAYGSRLDLGLRQATGLLPAQATSADRLPIIVLLTDGLADQASALAAAAEARARGLSIYTVGLGPDVDAALLEAIAGSRRRYYASPDGRDLSGIYLDIARISGCDLGFW
jgi:Mg-chelatase subunit ChlD